MEDTENKIIEKDMTPKLIGETYLKYPKGKSKCRLSHGIYECQYCNKEFEAKTNAIKFKNTKSCGCLKGQNHGLSHHKLYNTAINMIQRCTNPNDPQYKDYGGRGITVCEDWLNPKNFIDWAQASHPNIEGVTLDRIDNDKGYSPDNCRWADKTTQVINQRIKKNNTSGFVGVDFKPNENKYVARITVLGNGVYIGTFLTKEEAVQARDNYITQNNLPHKLSTDYREES